LASQKRVTLLTGVHNNIHGSHTEGVI